MNKKQIRQITGHYCRELNKQIRKVVAGFDEEAIHQLRVTYKKLRAFLRMLTINDTAEKQFSIPKKLKRVYRSAGIIRDLQLQKQRVLEAAGRLKYKPQAYLRFLQAEVEQLKQAFEESYALKPVDDCKKKTAAVVPEKFTELKFMRYVQQKWNAIQTITAEPYPGDREIHAIRKHLKDLFYNVKLFETVPEKTITVRVWKGKDPSFFYRLLEEMGHFQDLCNAIVLLDTYQGRKRQTKEREHLVLIRNKWMKEKRNLKKSLLKKLLTACPS